MGSASRLPQSHFARLRPGFVIIVMSVGSADLPRFGVV